MNTQIQPMSHAPASDSPGVALMPPRVFMLCLAAGCLLEFAYPWRLSLPFSAHLLLGPVLVAGGFWFMMWGHGRFKILGVNVKTNLPASLLVQEGAYRYSSNPMYVGFLALLAGIGLIAGSAWIVLAALPLAAYLEYYVTPREEAYLHRAFGREYDAYRRTVRRWL